MYMERRIKSASFEEAFEITPLKNLPQTPLILSITRHETLQI